MCKAYNQIFYIDLNSLEIKANCNPLENKCYPKIIRKCKKKL